MRKQRQEREKDNSQLEENENTSHQVCSLSVHFLISLLKHKIQRAVTIGVERGLEFESGRGLWERKKEEGEML